MLCIQYKLVPSESVAIESPNSREYEAKRKQSQKSSKNYPTQIQDFNSLAE